MKRPSEPASIADICEVETFAFAGAQFDAAPDLLIEVPHGATEARHYAAVRRRLVGELPDGLQEFFYVNTDAGAPECARQTAQLIAQSRTAGLKALIVRSLIPRTFIDCNRILGAGGEEYEKSGITAAIPEYVSSDTDRRMLTQLYLAYLDVVERAYATVCGNGGFAIMLHTYAPRSVKLDRIDANVVVALREAYAPERYEQWEVRPDVDFISETVEGINLAPRELTAGIRHNYEMIGIQPTENVSYRLHPSTLGHRFSAKFPGRVLCIEISRALLADPFTPFEEMKISGEKAARMAAPIAAGYVSLHDV